LLGQRGSRRILRLDKITALSAIFPAGFCTHKQLRRSLTMIYARLSNSLFMQSSDISDGQTISPQPISNLPCPKTITDRHSA